MHHHARLLRTASFLVLAACLGPETAAAARFHVRVGGELTSGPSVANIWSLANCYDDLATALATCAPQDTVLLFAESHDLGVPTVLPALMTNHTFADDPSGAEIVLDVDGGLTADGTAPDCALFGLTIRGGEAVRGAAALTLVANGGLASFSLRQCAILDVLRSLGAVGGAALSAPGVADGLTITLDRCHFEGNRSPGRGGAVHVGAGYAVTAHGCTFTANGAVAGGLGGALAVNATTAPSSLVAQDCTFTDNSSAGPSGAIDAAGASVTLRRCDVIGSRSADAAGAFFAEGAGVRIQHLGGHTEPITVEVEDCVFADNRGNLTNGATAGDGGGLFLKGELGRMVDALVSECEFRGNVNAQGGGIYFSRFATGTVQYCRFIDNTAWYQGGGAMKGGIEENAGELVTFVYCEFLGNRAGYAADGTDTGEYSRGGGVMVRNQPRADLFNCTFVDNTVNGAGYAIGDGFAHALEGGEWSDESECTLVNCAFWGTGNDVQARSEAGGMAVVSHIAAQTGQLVLGLTPVAPVWLVDYPFVSPFDLSPTEGSPVIDMGTDLGYTRDLLGVPVPSGALPDIGAHEYRSPVGVEDDLPARQMSLTAYPNPFNPRTTLSLRIDATSTVALVVFDSRGHRIAELYRGVLPAGTHDLRWDGRDAGGREVAAGTYLARLDADGGAPVVTKLVLVR